MIVAITTHRHLLGSATESFEGMEVDTHIRFFTLVREGNPRLQVICSIQVHIRTAGADQSQAFILFGKHQNLLVRCQIRGIALSQATPASALKEGGQSFRDGSVVLPKSREIDLWLGKWAFGG